MWVPCGAAPDGIPDVPPIVMGMIIDQFPQLPVTLPQAGSCEPTQ
jgi:hypothetical protein